MKNKSVLEFFRHITRGYFFKWSGTNAGGGANIVQKNIILIIFGYAVNLEFKFKFNFDEERGIKIEKKSQNSKKNRLKIELNFAIIYKEKLIKTCIKCIKS